MWCFLQLKHDLKMSNNRDLFAAFQSWFETPVTDRLERRLLQPESQRLLDSHAARSARRVDNSQQVDGPLTLRATCLFCVCWLSFRNQYGRKDAVSDLIHLPCAAGMYLRPDFRDVLASGDARYDKEHNY